MKKAFALFMLFIFLFNVGGYHLALWALEFKSNKDLHSRIESNNYSSEETIEIRIPVNLPYPLQEREFEAAHGRFEYNGEFYQLVKHKIENDMLVVICLKNEEQKQAVETVTDYVNLANDLPGTAKKAFNIFGKTFKEYHNSLSFHLEGSNLAAYALTFFTKEDPLIDRSFETITPPPKG